MEKNLLLKKCNEISSEIRLHGNNHIVDGIINIDKYLKSKYKILWVLKDPNSEDTGWTMQDYLSVNEIKSKIGTKQCTISYKIYKNILLPSFGILNGFPNYADIKDSLINENVYGIGEYLAYINIKKAIGKGEVKDHEVSSAYKTHKNLLLKQIKTYNPDIIIFGNTFTYFVNDLPAINWDISNAQKIFSSLYPKFPEFYKFPNNKLIVYAYHPACRYSYEYYYTAIIQGIKESGL